MALRKTAAPRATILDHIVRLDPERDSVQLLMPGYRHEFPVNLTRACGCALFGTPAIPQIPVLLDSAEAFNSSMHKLRVLAIGVLRLPSQARCVRAPGSLVRDAIGEVTAMTATPPWWLPFGQLWALATVLANAFAPKWLPSYGRAVIRLPFGLVLIAAQTWGVLVYVPGRAVAVLTPPSNRPRLITNELTRLSRTHWHLSNFGAWPTGTGVGTVLLNHVCELADAAQINTCLRASNRDNQRLYRRFGFRRAADSVRGTTMVRRFQPSRNPLASPAECEDARLAGRLAKTLARQWRQAPNRPRSHREIA